MYRLPRSSIIKSKRDFQRIYENAKSLSNRYLVLYYEKAEKAKENKIGFAAGKRLGCAVIRNRVKRLMRESYRLVQAEAKPGYNILLVGRNPAVNAKEEQIEKALSDLLKKSGLLKK